jgi:hypothetical protein
LRAITVAASISAHQGSIFASPAFCFVARMAVAASSLGLSLDSRG